MSIDEAPASPVRTAVVQSAAAVGLGHRGENLERAERRLRAAAAEDARLIVLPELATTGYAFRDREEAFAHGEAVPDGPSVQMFARVAQEREVFVVGCVVEQDGPRLYDTAVLVGPDGFIGRYRKTHLYDREKLWFTPGDEGFTVFETSIGRVGLLVCWDIWFPETARIVSQLGADIICIPTGWVDGGAGNRAAAEEMYDARGVCMAAHLTYTAAHVNNVFIATAATTGLDRDVRFLGNSLIADTTGWPVGQIAAAEEETTLYADLDLGAARSSAVWSGFNDLHRDRRTDLYDQMLGYDATPFPR